ncbi:divalent metal cation transporter MntH-like [Clytia hemisphaerica]|uniref:Uncharacterized protein n=1 Tax=Clytia hemisphaerica TaxID=252671 RepID=A0A7M5UPM2_9CNID
MENNKNERNFTEGQQLLQTKNCNRGESHTRSKMRNNKIFKEIVSLLYWTMLAACTVGPGTVVTCARAGAEFDLNLIWALIFASILSYTLQEGTARLTIKSGKSLGQCLQAKYKHGRLIWGVGVICWVVAVCVFLGNTFYSCNNWAGGMSAIYALPGAGNTVGLRVGACFGYGFIVIAISLADKTDSLGVGLGVVMIAMVILFLVVVVKLGLDGARFAKGLLPISMPAGSTNIVLSLVGTTAIGFNLFLGGQMAEGKTLPQAQRGIAFSTVMTLIVSVLIMIVGDGTELQKGLFTIANLSGTVENLTGGAGLWIFCLGFIAAALSSMLVCPLGSVMTCESVFNIYAENDEQSAMEYKSTGEKEQDQGTKEGEQVIQIQSEGQERLFPKKYARALMVIMVSVAVIVNAANAPPVKVILVAQVFNGCLLPFFSICLLICLNDPQFMASAPQKGWSNCFLTTAVIITLFLTANSMIQNLFGWTTTNGHILKSTFDTIKFSFSGVIAVAIMLCLFLCTSLGKNVCKSLNCFNRVEDLRT